MSVHKSAGSLGHGDKDSGGETEGGESLTDDGSRHIRNGRDLAKLCVSMARAPEARTCTSTYQAAYEDPVIQAQAGRPDQAGSKAQHQQGNGEAYHGGADSSSHRPLIVVDIVRR